MLPKMQTEKVTNTHTLQHNVTYKNNKAITINYSMISNENGVCKTWIESAKIVVKIARFGAYLNTYLFQYHSCVNASSNQYA